MVSTQPTNFSAAHRAHHSQTLVTVNEADSAAEQFIEVLDQLLGKNAKVSKADSFNELDVKPAEMLYRQKEEAAPVNENDENEQSDVKTEQSTKDNQDAEQNATLDAATASLIVNREHAEKKEAKVSNDLAEKTETQLETTVTKAEVAEHVATTSAQRQSMSEAFKLIKQIQAANTREEAAQPIKDLQANLENSFDMQPDKAQAVSEAVKSGVKSDFIIEKFIEAYPEVRDYVQASSKPNPLKQILQTSPMFAPAAVNANLVDKYSPELAKLATRASIGTKLMQDISREREPVASLSLLGEKNKVQTNKETGKTTQLTSRQEQIINQILKLVDQAAKLKDGTSITIKVQPQELGEVTVKVSQRGDQLIARIIPEHKEVEHTVRSGINEVVAQLVSAGFKLENIHVSVGKERSETESFSAFHNGLANQSQDQSMEGQNLLGKGDRHGSGLSNSDSSSSKSDSKNALSTFNGAVDNGWVA